MAEGPARGLEFDQKLKLLCKEAGVNGRLLHVTITRCRLTLRILRFRGILLTGYPRLLLPAFWTGTHDSAGHAIRFPKMRGPTTPLLALHNLCNSLKLSGHPQSNPAPGLAKSSSQRKSRKLLSAFLCSAELPSQRRGEAEVTYQYSRGNTKTKWRSQ